MSANRPAIPLVPVAVGDLEPARSMRVGLVNMPWALPDRPSIQCGLLKAGLERYGHEVSIHYLNLDLAAFLGHHLYIEVAELGSKRLMMLGEWLFTAAAFGADDDGSGYREAFPEIDDLCREIGVTFEDLCRLRTGILPKWLRGCMAAVEWSDYDIVGFSSTFDQQVSALGAAALVKELAPAVSVVFGGANVDGEMGPEYLRIFRQIDYVVIGEADEGFPSLVADISHGREPKAPGVCRRLDSGEIISAPPKLVQNMDDLPVPDYSEYFEGLARLGRSSVLGLRPSRLLAEFSRGCWWGEKHHCTFCGLNALGMTYRSKSPERAAEDIIKLASGAKNLRIDAVDNILDMGYIEALCRVLAPKGYDLSLFFEVKANLSADQMKQLRGAGVTEIQPGIESLSTRVLRIMDKGTDMLINVRLLRLAREHRISVGWNILTGFPGEIDEDYDRQAELIPSLHHLEPPSHMGELWLERFSPYFQNPPEEFYNIRPAEAYSHVYPFEELDHSKISYFFEHERKDGVAMGSREALRHAVDAWRERWISADRRPRLRCLRGPGWIRIVDERQNALHEHLLDGWRAAAYLGCGPAARTARALARQLRAETSEEPTEEEVARFLDACVADRLMVTERGRYLSLALTAPK